MRTIGFTLAAALVILPATAVPVRAQATGDEAPATASDPAAKAFEPLRREFDRLQRSITNLGALDDRSKPLLAEFRDRVFAFADQWPGHSPAVAVAFQLSIWLGETDDARVESMMSRAAAGAPSDAPLLAMVGDYFNRRTQYGRTIELLAASGLDFSQHPRAALALSTAQFAEHRFAESAELLESIPAAVREKNPQLNGEISTALATRRQYVDFWAQEQVTRNREIAADDLPQVELLTSRGRIVLELFENEAPNTVANFISLVESGFYAQTRFHRVIANFMAQGGDPNTKPGGKGLPGTGGPGYTIADECLKPEARRHFSGSLSMAKETLPNTGGSQFFLTHLPTPHLNGKHTVFGVILEGLDIARSIRADDELQAANVLRKRDREYKPTTIPLPSPTIIPPPSADDSGAKDDSEPEG
jgi:cyclophilin family peptidyl-prolyl cis-trans isomerase